MSVRLTGKEAAASLNERTKDLCCRLSSQGITPVLCIIRVGENPGDLSYERGAARRCEELGIQCIKQQFSPDVTQEEMMACISSLNSRPDIHGVLLLRPLPRHLDQAAIENALVPEKDVDGMTEGSMAGIYSGKKIGFAPCTAQACLEILDYYGIDPAGKRAVVVGRSLVIGKPVSMLLLNRNATVTVCHTRTADLPSVTKEADLLITAAGRAAMIGEEHVRPGQTVIDVGINVNEEGKLCGDTDYDAVKDIVGAVTPVPGGVGSVTTAVLCAHVAEAASRQALL